jgi:hypothetical protein
MTSGKYIKMPSRVIGVAAAIAVQGTLTVLS